MKALCSLFLTLLLLPLSAFSSKEATPPKKQPQQLWGTWTLVKYVHNARSSAGTLFRKDSTLIPPHSSTFWVTFQADGTVERPSATGDKETYAYQAPTIVFYYNGVTLPSNVTSSITELTTDKLRIAYRREEPGIISYDDFFYVRQATPYSL
ncbi:hypothetical protein [Hymenobacter arizonensis]|uniref:Lipocalin-like domain-containing protein n=1 Tax=Hymenobacter arizonensis TaxID=1227077 RepID=A0A1I6BD29_HYMAR|nr:hypothetical protein [Hymenobacter arizonensis]SFQ78882.1 hypothetical protein SAMN04515668_4373 [Hymenobacter arizonensis]